IPAASTARSASIAAPLGLGSDLHFPPSARARPPLRVSQIRVSRSPAVAMREPSGLHDAEYTPPACPLRASTSAPVRASHTRAVPSQLAVAMREPSGLHDAEYTPPACPFRASTSAP